VKTAFECGFAGWPGPLRVPAFRIPKPFLIEFITASRQLTRLDGAGEDLPITSFPWPPPPPPPPPPLNANIRIAGIEVTQGIQYCNINGQGSGFAGDNSVPLVENKTTVLRVYPDVDQYAGWQPLPSKITGKIEYPGVNFGDPDSKPINGPLDAKPVTQINRGDPNHTLNFRLPAERCKGTFTISVQLFDPAHPNDRRHRGEARSVSPTFVRLTVPFPPYFEITDYRLRLVCVPIVWVDPASGSTIGPPSDVTIYNTLSDSLIPEIFPVSTINYTGFLPPVVFGRRLNGADEIEAWEELYQKLREVRSASGSNDVHLGLVHSNVPVGNQRLGVGWDGVAVAHMSSIETVAHEIGHAFMREHAPCGTTTADVDPGYPTYASFPAGSIGEFGFNRRTSDVFDPTTVSDIMAPRCSPRWISPYTFYGLRNNIFVRDWIRHPVGGPGGVAPPGAALEREYLHLNFRVYKDGRVELLSSFHLSGLVPEAEHSPRSAITFELRDASSEVIGFYRCHLADPVVDPDSPYHDFYKMVPWEGETRTIAIFRDGEELTEVEVEEQAPQMTTLTVAELDDASNRVRLEWAAEHETKPVTYLLRYSNDGGEKWVALAAGLTEPRFEVDLDRLPGGRPVFFR
jgi:hypothetical protein